MGTDMNREMGEIKAQVRHLSQDINEIKSDVKSLLEFKWRLIGFASITAFAATILAEMVRGR
jgi:hypothetical protein